MKKFLLYALRHLAIFGLLATLTLSIIGYCGTGLRYFELASRRLATWRETKVYFTQRRKEAQRSQKDVAMMG